MAVSVPVEVANALNHFYTKWSNMSKDSINLMFMAIPFTQVSDEALVLKTYAKAHPTKYLDALVYGYQPSIDLVQEVEQLLSMWLAKEYVGDEKTDVKNFAKLITNHVKSQL